VKEWYTLIHYEIRDCGSFALTHSHSPCGQRYSDSTKLPLQESWDQHPLVSIACLVMCFHLLRSWAKLFSSCSPVLHRLHQLTMLSIHSVHGCLFYSFCLQFRTSVSLTSCCAPSCICSQTVRVSSEWLVVADLFQFWVFHIFHGLFFALSNWYIGSMDYIDKAISRYRSLATHRYDIMGQSALRYRADATQLYSNGPHAVSDYRNKKA